MVNGQYLCNASSPIENFFQTVLENTSAFTHSHTLLHWWQRLLCKVSPALRKHKSITYPQTP